MAWSCTACASARGSRVAGTEGRSMCVVLSQVALLRSRSQPGAGFKYVRPAANAGAHVNVSAHRAHMIRPPCYVVCHVTRLLYSMSRDGCVSRDLVVSRAIFGVTCPPPLSLSFPGAHLPRIFFVLPAVRAFSQASQLSRVIRR